MHNRKLGFVPIDWLDRPKEPAKISLPDVRAVFERLPGLLADLTLDAQAHGVLVDWSTICFEMSESSDTTVMVTLTVDGEEPK